MALARPSPSPGAGGAQTKQAPKTGTVGFCPSEHIWKKWFYLWDHTGTHRPPAAGGALGIKGGHAIKCILGTLFQQGQSNM